MRAYEEYKKIDLPWLEEIPAHWKVQRAKNLFKVINERSEEGKEELLSVSSNHGVVKRNDANVTMFQAESYEGYKLCWPEDLVINSLWAWQNGLGFSNFYGIVSTAYSVYRLNTPSNNYRFFDYLLRSSAFHWELRTRSKGIWKSRYILSDEDFLNSPIICPPREEQDAIVRFLDAKCAKIDRLIKLKERQIELLNEKKQNIINQAVTKGLDPHAPMKDSGVDWIGEIPDGWEVILAGRLINKIEQGWSPTAVDGEREQGQNAVLSLSAVKYGEFNKHAIKPLLPSIQIKEELKVKKNDILLTRSNTRQLVGDCCLVEEVEENTIFSDLIYRIKLNHDMIYDNFFVFYMISSYARFQIERMASGSSNTMPKLSHKNIRSIIFSVPQIDEQKKIASFIERELDPIKEEIENARKSVRLLQELKSRFIQECCTGSIKIDF